VLIDSIEDIAGKLKASFPETGYKGKEESTNAIESFMAGRL
jgi:hypothetical protein